MDSDKDYQYFLTLLPDKIFFWFHGRHIASFTQLLALTEEDLMRGGMRQDDLHAISVALEPFNRKLKSEEDLHYFMP